MKYKLTNETITHIGRTLHRIEALQDFGGIKAGDRGGYIEREYNLDQDGMCWVHDDAKVWGKTTKVWGNAEVYGNAVVYRDAEVYGNAVVYGNAKVWGNVEVYGTADVFGNAKVWGNAKVYGNAKVWGNAEVYGDAEVYRDAEVCGNAVVWGNAKVWGNVEVYGTAYVFGNAKVWGNAEVFGDAKVCGNAEVYGDANICRNEDYIVFKNWWSSGRYFTWTRSNNMWKAGCFYGTGEELIEKAYKDSETSGREYERIVKYVEAICKENEI